MLKNKEYLAKGKRSVVYKGLYQGKSAVMKIAKKGSPPNIIKNETRWLKKLEKYAIGPKLYSEGKDYMICEFLEGKRIMDWLEEHNKKEILQAIRVVLKQCMILDKLEVNKKELQRPTKHIIIGKKIKMIDFERCKQTKSPKNVTQFCQFLTSSNMKKLLDKKNIHI
ncbi:MAG: hypothetical protein L6408_09550, partial [Nanoarchaeota archaeon]|nr:hypothetical protein [Nanoarchaeota archaeon]